MRIGVLADSPGNERPARRLAPERSPGAGCLREAGSHPGRPPDRHRRGPFLGERGPSRAFLGADVLALLVLLAFIVITRGTADVRAQPPSGTAPGPLPEGIVRFAAATMLASLLAGALIGYGAISLHGAGRSEHDAARALALGSLAGIGVRVLSGWLPQRLGLSSWWLVSAMAWSGAVGALCLTSDRAAISVAGLLVAFALGWGWSGLAFGLVLVASGERSGAAGAALRSPGSCSARPSDPW